MHLQLVELDAELLRRLRRFEEPVAVRAGREEGLVVVVARQRPVVVEDAAQVLETAAPRLLPLGPVDAGVVLPLV